MEILTQVQLEQITALVADRALPQAKRETLAVSITGSKLLARRALDWIPEAFSFAAVSHINGLNLPTTFSVKCSDGSWRQLPFSTEPIFAQAIQFALSQIHQPNSAFREVAEQGSAIAAVDNALNAGVVLTGATLAGPAMVGIPAETYSMQQPPSSLGNGV